MIAAEEILAHAEQVRVYETSWFKSHRSDMLKAIVGIEDGLRPTNLGCAIEDAPDLYDEDIYYSQQTQKMPTAGAYLLAKAWQDIRTVTVDETFRAMPGQPEALRKIGSLINEFLLPMNGIEVAENIIIKAENEARVVDAVCSQAEFFFWYAKKAGYRGSRL